MIAKQLEISQSSSLLVERHRVFTAQLTIEGSYESIGEIRLFLTVSPRRAEAVGVPPNAGRVSQ